MAWLITGGAGFIGSNLVRMLARRFPGQKLITLDALTYAGNLANLAELESNPNHLFIRGDIADRPAVDALFEEHKIDGVFHLAAESHVDRSIMDASAFIRTNVVGTHTLLEAARNQWGTNTGRFLHVSTDEVYGSLGPDDPAFSETTPYAPNSPYAASKAASDHFVRAAHHTHRLNTVTTNCSNNYGPWQFPEKLIPVMITHALESRPLPVYGDGMNVRDWIFVEDHCEALIAAFERGAPGRVYNIGAGTEVPNIRLVERICDLMDELRPEENAWRRSLITFVGDRPGHDRRYAIDPTRTRQELGWEPRHSFDQALRQTVQWYLDNNQWVADCLSGAYREYYERNYAKR